MKPATLILLVAALTVGAARSRVEAKSLTVNFTTTPVGGQYAPQNVVAVWIQGPGGTFVKTIGRWANVRRQHLVAWTALSGGLDVDAVSGATRANHVTPLAVTWNLLDKLGTEVPDGTYTIRMELTDLNANSADQNNQGTFTFVKGPAAQMQTALSNGGFTNVSIQFDPASAAPGCNNGVVDTGETCDPAVSGSCPTTCAVSGDACAPNVLVGAAASCTAACETQAITACVSGDGCCAEGCDELADTDCGANAVGTNELTGGCATSEPDGRLAMLGLLGVLVVLTSRKRRR